MTDFVVRHTETNDRGHVVVTVVDSHLTLHKVTVPPALVDTPELNDIIVAAIDARHAPAQPVKGS